MTDATSGSATAEKPDAGSPEAATGTEGGDKGSPAATQTQGTVDPFAGLETGSLDWLGKNGIKDVPGLVKKAVETEKLIGTSIRLPGEDAKQEDWDKVWSRLGKPDKADGYELAPPATMPEGLPYNQQFADWFKGAAHKASLPKAMAKSLHDDFVAMSVEATKAEVAARVDAANTDLAKLWGPKDSEQHKANAEYADRGIRALGGDGLYDALKTAGLLGPGREVLNAAIADAFAKAGRALSKEGELVGGNSAVLDNPFAEKTANLTEQMRLMRLDPNRARTLITAAGKKLADFGWSG